MFVDVIQHLNIGGQNRRNLTVRNSAGELPKKRFPSDDLHNRPDIRKLESGSDPESFAQRHRCWNRWRRLSNGQLVLGVKLTNGAIPWRTFRPYYAKEAGLRRSRAELPDRRGIFAAAFGGFIRLSRECIRRGSSPRQLATAELLTMVKIGRKFWLVVVRIGRRKESVLLQLPSANPEKRGAFAVT